MNIFGIPIGRSPERLLRKDLKNHESRLSGIEQLAKYVGDPTISQTSEAESLRNKIVETKALLKLSGTS